MITSILKLERPRECTLEIIFDCGDEVMKRWLVMASISWLVPSNVRYPLREHCQNIITLNTINVKLIKIVTIEYLKH
jgi:hypothetical protein